MVRHVVRQRTGDVGLKKEAARDMPPQVLCEFFATRIKIQGVRDCLDGRPLIQSKRRLERHQFA